MSEDRIYWIEEDLWGDTTPTVMSAAVLRVTPRTVLLAERGPRGAIRLPVSEAHFTARAAWEDYLETQMLRQASLVGEMEQVKHRLATAEAVIAGDAPRGDTSPCLARSNGRMRHGTL